LTGLPCTGLLTKQSIAISMDGKGAWRGNVLVERPGAPSNTWLAYNSLSDARVSIGRYLRF
jgi:putative transposase